MRDVMREYEWYYRNRSRRILKIHVLVTTYEALIKDYEEIGKPHPPIHPPPQPRFPRAVLSSTKPTQTPQLARQTPLIYLTSRLPQTTHPPI